MPVRIDIFDFKCFNQLRNGENFDQNLSDFTPNLVGNIGEKIAISYQANVYLSAFAGSTEEWDMQNTLFEIVRSSGSFLEDDIQVGYEFGFFPDWLNRKTGASEYIGAVIYVSSDGTTLRYTIVTGTPVTVGVNSNVGLVFWQDSRPVNRNTALFLKFGLIENDETFNYLSKTTEALQVYYVGELIRGGGFKDSEPLGSIRDWVTGKVEIEFVSGEPDFGAAEYQIKQEFVLNPFYILSFREFIDSGTIPEILAGDSSLKYAAELDFRKTLTDTGSSKIQSFDGLDGFVGWYGENFNGLNNDYQIKSITYEEAIGGDPLDGININVSTKAIITVENIGGAITDYSCSTYLIKIPKSEDDYIGTTTDMLENFLFKSEIVSSPDTSSANVTTSLVTGDLVIEYTIDYLTAEKLQLTTDDEYMLLVQVEDPTIAVGNSDRVMLIAALRNYVDIDFLADFINIDSYNFLQHGLVLGVDDGVIAPITSNEDGILLDAVFGANTVRNVVINAITAKLIAFNVAENKSFEIDLYSFNIGELILSGGVQQIEVDTTRGYALPVGDNFNLVKVATGSQSGDFRQYSLQLGQKIKWQDAAPNPGVDSVFFDSTQPNNNLNKKSSNYSDKQSYDIRLALVFNVTGLDDLGRSITGDFVNLGGLINVEDYDESEDAVTGVIQTFDLETGNSLDGDILYNGKDTLFKAVFQDVSGQDYGIHRIEPSQSQGDGIIELSSITLPATNSLLKPLDGETLLKFTPSGSIVTTECLIDGSLITEGLSYKLSARIGVAVPPTLFTFTVKSDNAGTSNNDQFTFPQRLGTSPNFTMTVLDDTVADIIVTADTDPMTFTFDGGAGTYTIQITGTDIQPRFDNGADKEKMLVVSFWGSVILGEAAFSGCSNFDFTATDIPSVGPAVTEMFFLCSSMVGNPSIDDWDMSSIGTLNSMFRICSLFNQPIGSWNVSNVSQMNTFMQACSVFNQSLNTWTTSSLTSMNTPFENCNALNQPFSNWDTSLITFYNAVFNSADNFDQDLSNWDFTGTTGLSNLVANTSLSSANYNALLAKLRADSEGAGITSGMTLGANSLVATGQGVTDRTFLITNDAMTIIDAT